MSKLKMPAKVRVSCFTVDIIEWDNKEACMRKCFGEFSQDELIIRIDFAQQPQRVVETLIHEVMHAIYGLSGIKDEDKEERIVTAMSRGWMQMCIDNPDVVRFISDHTKGA